MIKQINRLILLHCLAVCGSLQTRDVSRLLQLSRSATVNVQAEMLEEGLVSRTGASDAVGYRYELSAKGAALLIHFGEMLKRYGSYSSFESPASTLLSDVQRSSASAAEFIPPQFAGALLFPAEQPKTGVQDTDDAK